MARLIIEWLNEEIVLSRQIYSLEEAAKLGPNVEFLWNGTTSRTTKPAR
jgi:hypothetical protein